ncbi:MAG: DUF4381 domain-containing protein [Alphaproteobacteria bacterium]|nr:DUF4381 domain-containing protein [Alphaproteobacteria bacterium]
MDNLPELRDIHLPSADISVFPLAYGWWLVLIIILAIVLLVFFGRRIRRASARLYATHLLRSLKDDHSIAAAAKMSEILRRICVRQYPEAVALSDKKWIAFINSKTKEKLSARTAELLSEAPYMPTDIKKYSTTDIDDLWRFCNHWIGDNL